MVGALREEGKLRDLIAYSLATIPFEDRAKRRPIFIMSESGSGSTWIAAMLGHLPSHVYIHELKIIREHGAIGRVFGELAGYDVAPGRLLYALFESFQRARLWTLRSHSEHLKTRPELLSRENLGSFDPSRPRHAQNVDVINSTGANIRIAPLLRRAYPNAILCYLVRDPRDTIASARYRKPFGKSASIEDWARAYVSRWEAYKRFKDGARIDLLRYEAWLDDAETELRSFLARHALVTDEETIAHAVFSHSASAIRAGKTKPKGNLGQAKAGKWRETLTEEDVRLIRPILEPVTHELGYQAQVPWS